MENRIQSLINDEFYVSQFKLQYIYDSVDSGLQHMRS